MTLTYEEAFAPEDEGAELIGTLIMERGSYIHPSVKKYAPVTVVKTPQGDNHLWLTPMDGDFYDEGHKFAGDKGHTWFVTYLSRDGKSRRRFKMVHRRHRVYLWPR